MCNLSVAYCGRALGDFPRRSSHRDEALSVLRKSVDDAQAELEDRPGRPGHADPGRVGPVNGQGYPAFTVKLLVQQILITTLDFPSFLLS